MLVPPERFVDLYENIKGDTYVSDERKVRIFVSTAQADSVCALRVLTAIFQADGVHYSVSPVSRYSEIQQICEKELDNGQELVTLVLINCGACEDMEELLQLKETVRVVVIDSHRPIHHNYNAEGNANLLLMYDPDDGTPLEDLPEADGASGSDDDDDTPSAAEAHDDQENRRPAQRQRTSEAAEDPGLARKSHRTAAEAIHRKRVEYYRRGTYWGKPAACLLFDLARMVQQDDQHLLWLSIVALTDQWVHQHISNEFYSKWYTDMETLVHTMQVDEEAEIAVHTDDGGVATTVEKPVYGKISSIDDFRFTLLRHWSLWEAMCGSTYVAVRLHTWHERGRREVEDLLAKMGMPLAQARALYRTVAPKYRQALPEKLALHAAAYRLSDVTFRSFQRQYGANKLADTLTAADTVYAVSALLEAPGKASEEGLQRDINTNFWRAWQALATRDQGELKAGMELAKRQQKAIVSDGGLILSRKMGLTDTQHFRLFDLSELEVANRALLAHPLAMNRLASFLIDAYFQERGKRKPVILVGPKNAFGDCLVVGVTAQPTAAGNNGNTLGTNFRSAAENIGAEFQHDGFNSSMIEVKEQDVKRFLGRTAVSRHWSVSCQPWPVWFCVMLSCSSLVPTS